MNILLTGGTGLIGKRLGQKLLQGDNSLWVLTRGNSRISQDGIQYIHWDGKTTSGWGILMSEMDIVINLAGEPLTRWPWTKTQKRVFSESRITAGQALAEAIKTATRRPKLLIQVSGINHYGVDGGVAAENTTAGSDFLSLLTLDWEDSTKSVEQLGVRRCVVRLGLVLSENGGLFPLLSFPVRLFIGGPHGNGNQYVSWIHIEDVVEALDFLIKNEQSRGPYNFVAPELSTNAIFTKLLAKTLKRPHWLRIPAFLFKLILGEMSILIIKGRAAVPKRLLEEGYQFTYANLRDAIQNLVA